MQLIFAKISKNGDIVIKNEKNIFKVPFYFIIKGIFELTIDIIVSIM